MDDELENLHPSIAEKLRFFAYDHLPPEGQTISKRFRDLAYALVLEDELEGPQLALGLQKLLEAKDCAVRAGL